MTRKSSILLSDLWRTLVLAVIFDVLLINSLLTEAVHNLLHVVSTWYMFRHFGNFARAFYTLFRVILGSWPDDVLVPFDEDGTPQIMTLVFFYSYVLIEVIVLLQVVVAGVVKLHSLYMHLPFQSTFACPKWWE